MLYRMNAQSNAVEQAFKRNGVPYPHHRGHAASSTGRRSRICWPICACSTTPTDDLRLRRIINVPSRGHRATTVETAQVIATEEGVPLYEIICHAADYPELKQARLSWPSSTE